MRTLLRGAIVSLVFVAATVAAPAAEQSMAATTQPTIATVSYRGTVAAVSVPKNRLTIAVGRRRYSFVVSQTTTYTVARKTTRLAKLRIGTVVRVTGREIGALYIALAVTG